jgi:hypothetical protein
MAKLISKQITLEPHGNYYCPTQKEIVAAHESPVIALYQMDSSLSGNVDFVLFLSGNSTFRVDVVAFEE